MVSMVRMVSMGSLMMRLVVGETGKLEASTL